MIDAEILLVTLRFLLTTLETTERSPRAEKLLRRLTVPRVGDLVVNTSMPGWWKDAANTVGVVVAIAGSITVHLHESGNEKVWSSNLVRAIPTPELMAEFET